MDVVEAKEGYTLLKVRVQPRSSRMGLAVEPDGRVRVSITAPPVENAANKALCDYLAKVFDIPRRSLTVVKGEKARDKTVKIDGLTAEAVKERLDKERKGADVGVANADRRGGCRHTSLMRSRTGHCADSGDGAGQPR